VLLIVDCRK